MRILGGCSRCDPCLAVRVGVSALTFAEAVRGEFTFQWLCLGVAVTDLGIPALGQLC